MIWNCSSIAQKLVSLALPISTCFKHQVCAVLAICNPTNTGSPDSTGLPDLSDSILWSSTLCVWVISLLSWKYSHTFLVVLIGNVSYAESGAPWTAGSSYSWVSMNINGAIPMMQPTLTPTTAPASFATTSNKQTWGYCLGSHDLDQEISSFLIPRRSLLIPWSIIQYLSLQNGCGGKIAIVICTVSP